MCVTSRGCHWACSFCFYTTLYDLYGREGYLRARSPQNVVGELVAAKQRWDLRYVVFHDDIFPTSIRWLREFAPLYREQVGLPFSCITHPQLVLDETAELLAGLTGGAVTRAFCVGATVWLAMALWPGVHVAPIHLWAILWFGFLGAVFLAFIGVLTSIWAEKFDHAAAVTNFVIAPLALLSGTFYSVERLAPTFQAISHANPFFYIISGFRYGFLGVADSPVLIGALVVFALNLIGGTLVYLLLRSGWKIRS